MTTLTEKATYDKTEWMREIFERFASALGSSTKQGLAAWEGAALACGNEIVRRAHEA